MMEERKRIEQTINQLEGQRATLGDETIETALESLHRRLSELNATETGAVTGDVNIENIGERRVVTILFCDVAGSTALAESMDPEAWTGIMKEAFQYLIEPVERYSGTVARLMGDAILAFFGAPTAHEDDPQRAILAGLAIVEEIKPYREKLREEKGIDFNVRVGINTGLAVVGEVGSETAGEYTAMGDAVNLAARMEQTAAPGTIQISKDTYHHIAPLFETEALGEIRVKGKSQPVPAYRVLGRKAEPGRLRGLEERGLSSPLVGRDEELAVLEEIFDRLQARNEGAIVLVLGEAGLGKTTLVEAVRGRVQGDSLRWLEGHSLSFGQSLSYWPFREILWGFAGISEDDDEDRAWDKLEKSVSRLFPEQAGNYLPYLASLLALEVREPYREKVAYLDAEALGRQVYLTSRRFFERLALDRPLVLLFEDLHWMDDASTRLLEHLLPLSEHVPLAIVGLSRPESGTAGDQITQLARQKYAAQYTELSLSRLPPEESRTLVQNLLSIDDLPDHVRQMIVDRAGGNPFFLEEIIRTLIDSGAVEQDTRSGRWRATKSIETLQLPDTVQGVVIARVDRLAEEVKQVLRTASVVGRSFLYRLLREVMQLDRELDRELAALQEIDLIREVKQQPELEYIFKHALAQEAIYESILLERRHYLHRSVAETIEALFGERLEEFYGLLAYHYAQAEAWEQALDYLLKAGDWAGQVGADEEALAHYRQALAAYEQAFGDRWDPLQRATLERKMGQALFRRGMHAQAEEHLNLALKYLGRSLPSSRWAVRRALLVEGIQQALIRLAPILMRKSGSPEEFTNELELIIVYETIGIIDAVRDQERFMLETLKGVNLWERIGHQPAGFAGYAGLAMAFDFVGLFGLSKRYNRLAVKVAQEQEHPLALGYVHYGLAVYNSWLGLPDKALKHGTDSARFFQAAGFLRGWGYAQFMMAETLIYQGLIEEAQVMSNEMLVIGREGADAQLEAYGLMQSGFLRRLAGDPDEAIALFHQSDVIARSIPDYFGQVQAAAMIGRCYLEMDHLEQALNSLHEAERILQEHNVIGGRFVSMVRIGLVEAYLLAAERDGEDSRKAKLAQAKRACREAEKSTRKYRPFRAEVYRLQGTYEWLAGREQQARQWWEKSLALAGEIGQPYEQAMTYLEMGRRQGDPENLRRAELILEDTGVKLYMTNVRDELTRLAKN